MSALLKIKQRKPISKLTIILCLLFLVIGVGIVGFSLAGHRSLLDSFYLTLVTISTLGMLSGEYHFNDGEKLVVMFMIVVGIAVATTALSTLVAVVVEGQVRGIFGRRKVDKIIASLNRHIVVCGYGRTGASVCETLQRRDVPIVVVERDEQACARAEEDGLLYIRGDASEESVLIDAGIKNARGLISVLDSDAANVFVTLIARDLNPKIVIAARSEKPESQSRLKRAGANEVVCSQIIGATRLANILTRPGVVNFLDFAAQGVDLEAEQYRIGEGNKLIGQSLRQANLPRQVGVLIIALKRHDGITLFNPDPDTVIQLNDQLLVTGKVGSLARLEHGFAPE